jgi:hypothetical protein
MAADDYLESDAIPGNPIWPEAKPPDDQSEPWDSNSAPDVYPEEEKLPAYRSNLPANNYAEDEEWTAPIVGV